MTGSYGTDGPVHPHPASWDPADGTGGPVGAQVHSLRCAHSAVTGL